MPQPISITAFSTALFSTWIYIEPYGLLFDCGDGVTSALLQRARKVQYAFISHPDRDHLAGLLQFHQLNGREGLTICYPKDSGSFQALAKFTASFDPHINGTCWKPLASGDFVKIKNDLCVRTIANRHVESELTKSLSYIVERSKKKLRSEFSDLIGNEIARKRQELGDEALFETVTEREIIYSGDTPVENDGRYSNARVLIHESTFLRREELGQGNTERNHHSSLDAVMEMVAESNVEYLILGHFSSRYSDAEIDNAISVEKARCGINIPIAVIYPGRVAHITV